MRKGALCAVAALALAAAACSGPKQQEFTKKDAQDIRQRNDAFVQAFNGGQVPQLVNLYAESVVFMPPNQPVIRGKDALKNYYDEMLKATTDLRLNVTEVGGAGPIAYQSGTYEMTLKGKGADHDRGKFLFVMRNMGGTWRYEYTMWNSDLPPHATTNTD
jgi:ketosteroid isomerase-like protein